MKLKTLLLMIGLIACFQSFSQQIAGESQTRYITLTRNVQQLVPILLAADELAKEDGSNFGQYEIVICGQTVSELAKPEVMNPLLDLVKHDKIKVIACGFSLKKFGVDEASIPEGMDIVQNGILYGFQLQKQGYYMISL